MKNKDVTFKVLYQNLKLCVEKLESDVRQSLLEAQDLVKTVNDQCLALLQSQDNHYKEIIHGLVEIKVHIDTISYHDKSIIELSEKIKREFEDINVVKSQNYVQKCIKTFDKLQEQNGEGVRKRETANRSNKDNRDSDIYSQRYLDAWETLLEQKEIENNLKKSLSNVPVPRRNKNSVRNKKKFVSSTLDVFLEEEEVNRLGSLIEEEISSNRSSRAYKTESLYDQKPSYHLVQMGNISKSVGDLPDIPDYPAEGKLTQEILELSASLGENMDFSTRPPPRVIDVLYKKNSPKRNPTM